MYYIIQFVIFVCAKYFYITSEFCETNIVKNARKLLRCVNVQLITETPKTATTKITATTASTITFYPYIVIDT